MGAVLLIAVGLLILYGARDPDRFNRSGFGDTARNQARVRRLLPHALRGRDRSEQDWLRVARMPMLACGFVITGLGVIAFLFGHS